MSSELLFAIQVDCESTQPSVRNPRLGEAALSGLADMLAAMDARGTFFAIPGDIEAHRALYQQFERAGHEIGLHIHVEVPGASEFLGERGPDEQQAILVEGMDRFAQVLGRRPRSFCPGYFSANDHTFAILEQLGFTHGAVSLPTRDLPQCASVWGGSSLDPRFPHRYNRVLNGDVNFVDLPVTIDPTSRLWGGGHPLDLRVELVDAKNHWYTMDKAVRRQRASGTPLLQLHALTHNTFDYSDPRDFRRETLAGLLRGARQIAEANGVTFRPVTLEEMAQEFRKRAVPPEPCKLTLDIRGRSVARV